MQLRVAALLTTITAIALPLSGATATYTIHYAGGPSLHVDASLPAGDGRLLIAQGGGIDQLPNQWATFVRNLSIDATPAGKEGWTIATQQSVTLSYDVALEYAVGQWPAGNEQSGRLFSDALYTVTKPLFLYTSSTTDAIVRFDVPPASKVATPWTATGARTYRAVSVQNLIDNTIVLGAFPAVRVQVGAFDVTVATPGARETPPLLARALAQIGVMATTLFDKTPRGVYLMTFLHEASEDGESYENSAAVASPDAFDRAGMIVTGNTLVHEVLHHWIGGQIAPSDHDSIAWFTEGFTEYYANMAVSRSGAVPPDLMLHKFANVISGYLYFFNSSVFHGVTVAAAAEKKGPYRFGVYNAGWAIALSLDVDLRTRSNGIRSLDDVMRLLYARNGLTGEPLTAASIQKAVEDVGGRSYATFFQTFVAERNDLPINETVTKLGLSLRGQPYAADMFLIETQKDNALRKAMFGF